MTLIEKLAVLKMAGYDIFFDEPHEAWDWVIEDEHRFYDTAFKYHDTKKLATEDAWNHFQQTHQNNL